MISWTVFLSVLIIMLCAFYLWEIGRSYKRRLKIDLQGIEGFQSGSGSGSSVSEGLDQRLDDRCYDAFYAKVYDPLVQPTARAGMEVRLPLEWLQEKGREKKDLRVVDLGSGTGLHAELFARDGVASVVGVDKSVEMVEEARRKYPEREFVVGDITKRELFKDESVDLATLFYFTIYMIPDRTAFLRNIYHWLAPGGLFTCHIVNKLKFDPILEAASPFAGFSVQKYVERRVTKSEVAFEEFDYVGDFQLNGSRGIYEEEFRFKDGRVRRHEQRVWMPNIDVLVKEIVDAGFTLQHHADLTAIGYEYQYQFFFTK